MDNFEQALQNCAWGKGWKLIQVANMVMDDGEVLVPSSHPDSDAELENEPVRHFQSASDFVSDRFDAQQLNSRYW